MKFIVEFNVPDDEYGTDPVGAEIAFATDLQALLYDNGDGATRDALAGGFTIDRTTGGTD